MKKIIVLLAIVLVSLRLNSQNFNALTANGSNKKIEWTTSTWANGYGHKIYSLDPGGKTLLNIAARHNNANWTDLMTFTSQGKVGIGTTNPATKLDVRTSTNKAVWLNFQDESAVTFFPNNGNSVFHISHGHNNKLYISQGGNVGAEKLMTFVNNGNIGIGTTNPDEKLTVKGKIHAEEIIVDLNVPADYVFQKYYTGISHLKEEYTMPTLEEVEAFTKENHHLPNIPSAETIQKEGMQLSKMTNLLLQKIEELTLYTIEQQKRIKALEGKLVEKEKND